MPILQMLTTGQVIEDGMFLLFLVAVLGFFWFHGWHRKYTSDAKRPQSKPAAERKRAA